MTVHNYVYGNCEGIYASGSSKVVVDHTSFTANMRGCNSRRLIVNPYLVRTTHGSAGLTLRNALIYDNDRTANPGVQQTCANGNTPGILFNHDSTGTIELVSSTVVDNQNDLIVHWATTASGTVVLNQTYFPTNCAKVLSASIFSLTSAPTCPPLVVDGSVVYGNPVVNGGYGSTSTCPRLFHHRDLQADSSFVPTAMFIHYPHFEPIKFDLYKLGVVLELPSALPLPPGLFTAFGWSVDAATIDSAAPTDVGYHNPI